MQWTIGIILIVNAVWVAINIVQAFRAWMSIGGSYVIYPIVFICCYIPLLIAAFYYFRFFLDMGDQQRKEKLPLSCALVVLTSVLIWIWWLIFSLIWLN